MKCHLEYKIFIEKMKSLVSIFYFPLLEDIKKHKDLFLVE
ncbi:hypothetical protein LCGC14_1063840 [marine sediment metagenome]|uniref:Uncharacterized protein n=1 Tax=marine sediment metagenome TaxID=412755 RepID=A0A0F9N771_9ZZZZ